MITVQFSVCVTESMNDHQCVADACVSASLHFVPCVCVSFGAAAN